MALDTSNTFDQFRNVHSLRYQRRLPFTGAQPTKPIPNDSYSFTHGMSENLNLSEEKSIAGPVVEGTLNSKNTVLKVLSQGKDTYYEGVIGDKNVMLMQKNQNIVGQYGGKEVNLTYDCNKPSALGKFFNCTLRGRVFKPDYFNISGTIDGKPVSINLPNAEIPQDEDTRDMVSLTLLDYGLEAETFGNKIVGLGYARHQKSYLRGKRQRREKKIDENIKPLVMQTVSTIASVALGALLVKLGIKH